MCPMSVNMSGRLCVMSENSNVKYNVWKKINLFVIKKSAQTFVMFCGF